MSSTINATETKQNQPSTLPNLNVLADLRRYAEENKNNPATLSTIIKHLDRINDQLHNYPDIFRDLIKQGLIKETDIEIYGVNSILIRNCTNKFAAALLLLANPLNRKLSKITVNGQVIAMREGKWCPETNTIKIARKECGDQIIDGHHRLNALIKQDDNVAVSLIIQYNVSKEVEDTLDIGRKRNTEHVLVMKGFKNPTVSANALFFVKQSAHSFRLGRRQSCDNKIHSAIKLEGAMLSEFADKHRDIERFIPSANAHSLPSEVCKLPILTAAWYLLDQQHSDLAAYFIQKLCSGKGMGSYHPISLLHDRLKAETKNKTKKQSYEQDCFALIFKVWNCLVKKETRIRQLKLTKKETEEGVAPVAVTTKYLPWVHALLTNDMTDEVVQAWSPEAFHTNKHLSNKDLAII